MSYDLTAKFITSSVATIIVTAQLIMGIFPQEHFFISFAYGFVGQFISLSFFIYQRANQAIDTHTSIEITRAHYWRAMAGLFGSPVVAFFVSFFAKTYYDGISVEVVSGLCGLFFEFFAQNGFLKKIFNWAVTKKLSE